jgi:hypothetical protein
MNKRLKVNGIRSSTEFIKEIEQLVSDKKCEYMDAVILYCEQHDIEIETAASIIKSSSKVKARIQMEAEELNFLPKTAKLPI